MSRSSGNTNNQSLDSDQPRDVPARIFSRLSNFVLHALPTKRIEYHAFSTLAPDLYDGSGGLAVFFAAYYRATKDPQARAVALAALAPVRNVTARLLADPDLPSMGGFAIGGFVGLGSFLYALTAVADWMEDPELLDSASVLTRIISSELIRADRFLDMMRGSAGALLSLLFYVHVARTRGIESQPAFDRAVDCGRHLLHSRISHSSGLRVWQGIDGTMGAGFLHGATGIAYALARLYEQTKEEEFRKAAFEGFAFERTLYVSEQHGWRDPLSNRIIDHSSWCHGAAGIALGRLGCHKYLNERPLRDDLEDALHIASAFPEATNDQLCCGNFGRIEVLHTAGSVLERLQLSDRALASAQKIIERAPAEEFRFSTAIDRNRGLHLYRFNSSLFLGLAGIGYTLLRLSYPDLLPSILLMEAQS